MRTEIVPVGGLKRGWMRLSALVMLLIAGETRVFVHDYYLARQATTRQAAARARLRGRRLPS
jgi:hypothetical protein